MHFIKSQFVFNLGAFLMAEHVKPALSVNLVWGKDVSMKVGADVTLTSAATVIRHLARSSVDLYGSSILERTEVIRKIADLNSSN